MAISFASRWRAVMNGAWQHVKLHPWLSLHAKSMLRRYKNRTALQLAALHLLVRLPWRILSPLRDNPASTCFSDNSICRTAFRSAQGPCSACRKIWRLPHTELNEPCERHICNSTKLNGSILKALCTYQCSCTVRVKRCLTLSTPVSWQNWTVFPTTILHAYWRRCRQVADSVWHEMNATALA